jgi:uncharacterized protein YuzE
MKALSLQVTYRKGKPIAAYLYLPRQPGDKADSTKEPVEGLLVDYAGDGRPIGIEIRSPGYVSIEQINQVLDDLGIGRIPAEELGPLRAA